MIHIATVHFKSDRWIGIQQKFLQKHLRSPYRIYAWLNDVPTYPADAFYYVCTEAVGPHAIKLNLLAHLIQFAAASDDDLLIFMDGDAFPVGDIESLLREKLERHKLIAVQRLENNGDCQPHPCFCVTTVGFWRQIHGDWNEGFKWQGKTGKWVTDVGGNLLQIVQKQNVDWLPLRRTGGITEHGVLFGFYSNLIYHHGAGFRPPVTRYDIADAAELNWFQKLMTLSPERRKRVMRRNMANQNNLVSEQIFKQIEETPDYLEKLALITNQEITA